MGFEIQLERYSNKFFDTERDLIQTVSQFYLQYRKASPNCFSRDLLSGHFTASGLVVRPLGRPQQNNLLETVLTHHAKLDLWLQPGGHADENPNLLKVATQEVLEETGLVCTPLINGEIIDIDINIIPENSKAPEHLHYDIRYLFACEKEANFVMSAESIDMKWVPLDLIARCSSYDLSLQKLVNKAILSYTTDKISF
jgi:8-oxo-dGTP pyrophosphatase MutT (NUDIX family)